MRREIDHRPFTRETSYRAKRCTRDSLIRADTVDLAGKHELLVVGRVASHEEGRVAELSEDGDMTGRMTRRRDGDNGAVLGEARAHGKWSDLFRDKFERHGVEPGRPSVRKITTNAPCPSARSMEFSPCDKDFAGREVRKSPVVIHV